MIPQLIGYGIFGAVAITIVIVLFKRRDPPTQ